MLVRDPYGMQRCFHLATPMIEEFVKHGKAGRHVVGLPYEQLNELRMIGHPVADLGGGQAVALNLSKEIAVRINHHFVLPIETGTYEAMLNALVPQPYRNVVNERLTSTHARIRSVIALATP